MKDAFCDAFEELSLKLSSLFGFCLCKQEFYWLNKRFFAVVTERLLPFHIYNHLFLCYKGTQTKCNLCVRAVFQNKRVYSLFRSKLFVYKEIFQARFADIHLPNRKPANPDLLDNFYGFYTQKIVENQYFLFNRYLEVAFRVFLNRIQHQIFLHVRKIFNQNKPLAASDFDFTVVFIQC